MNRLRELFGSATAVQQGLIVAGVFILGFVVLGIISIRVWEVTNSTAFCANVCHDVHPEEPKAREDSYHANVECVECHMGRVSTLRKIVLKASHSRHLPETLFQAYDRPIEAETLIPPDQSCERCHWPPSFHGDTVREIHHYQQDRENTLTRTFFALRTGSGGARVETLGKGIHWHIANRVEFIAEGEEKGTIRWVQATFPDGTTVEYNDVEAPLSEDQIADADTTVMSCVDCHNQVGHPFYSPDTLLDLALKTGQISPDLPYVKQEMTELLTGEYENQEEALEAAADFVDDYAQAYPDVAADHQAKLEEAGAVADDLVQAVLFEEEGVTWESFPDYMGHGGHKPFPGCFRCHNGTLQSDQGNPIRVDCTLCHSIPRVVGPTERPPAVPAARLDQPASHGVPDWLSEHRWQASDACSECHGEIEFGTDDSSFCANSACHGQEWPELELDPTEEHPIPLTGGHAEAWCHDCHEGQRAPEYRCANCHDAPPNHYGPDCETCHTPQTFASAIIGEDGEVFDAETHPFPLDHGGADRDCALCHPGGDFTTYTCSVCHDPNRTKTVHAAQDINDIFSKCANCHP